MFDGNAGACRPVVEMSEEHKVFIDESGIVVSDYRYASLAPTPQTIRGTRLALRKLCPGRKVPLLVLAEVARTMDASMVDAVAAMADVVTKIAIQPRSTAGLLFANDFTESKVFPFPHRVFEREADARAWLLSPAC